MQLHGTGGSQEQEEVLAILMSLRDDVLSMGTKQFPEATESLWVRMGEEPAVKAIAADLYELHTTDPLTAGEATIEI
jgi:hypothetical protein